MKRVYLAGPEVFRPDAQEEGARLRAICAEHGLDVPQDVPDEGAE